MKRFRSVTSFFLFLYVQAFMQARLHQFVVTPFPACVLEKVSKGDANELLCLYTTGAKTGVGLVDRSDKPQVIAEFHQKQKQDCSFLT